MPLQEISPNLMFRVFGVCRVYLPDGTTEYTEGTEKTRNEKAVTTPDWLRSASKIRKVFDMIRRQYYLALT